MKSIFKLVVVLFCGQLCLAQEDSLTRTDTLYKEDQFYIGTTYNLLGKKPSDLSQRGFSTGIHFGVIKDMPLNDARTVAIGVGLGYSLNAFNQNLFISVDENNDVNYAILESSDSYTKNKFSNQLVELPIEFRWRTSTPTEYKFWRVYTGFKLGYMLTNVAKHKGDLGTFKFRNIDDFNKLQYGLTLSVGYNTWNLHLYYALNPVFSNSATLNEGSTGTNDPSNGTTIDMNVLKIGLMFYIL